MWGFFSRRRSVFPGRRSAESFTSNQEPDLGPARQERRFRVDTHSHRSKSRELLVSLQAATAYGLQFSPRSFNSDYFRSITRSNSRTEPKPSLLQPTILSRDNFHPRHRRAGWLFRRTCYGWRQGASFDGAFPPEISTEALLMDDTSCGPVTAARYTCCSLAFLRFKQWHSRGS